MFDLEERLNNTPGLAGTTFLMEVAVTHKDKTQIFKAYESQLDATHIVEGTTGLVRGIPPELSFVYGMCLGATALEFDTVKLVLSIFDTGHDIRHLNVSMQLKQPFIKATGILGQTVYPEYLQKPNETFQLVA